MGYINQKVTGGGSFRLNKYIIIFLFIFFLLTVGTSYAYFAYQVEDSVAIKGNIVAIDAELDVQLVVGTNEDMVPLQNEALSTAINGIGSDNGACIDSQGNLSCQVYKITLTNKGSRIKHLRGTIELYAKTGSTYTNLKWRELTDLTTIKDGSVINDMEKSILVSDLTIQSKEVITWYIAVWISEADYDQTNTDEGEFGGTVTFETVDTETTEFIEEVLEQNAQSDSEIDFTQMSSEENGTGIFVRSGTESNTYPIYYYRGAVADNNLIFAGFCWKIVRTTETGGLKLIYNGTPTSGTCDNTDDASVIGDSAFNTNYNSPAYAGYMYGTPYLASTKSMSSITDTYYYGNDVTYSNGQYTLTDTITSSSWSSIYNGGLDNYHYTCFSTGTTCSSVAYIYYTNSSTAYYLTLTDGKRIGSALREMLEYNTYSSTIKGNNTTEGTLDYWYYTNIQQKNYASYIEDTIWCNDRSIWTLGGFDPDGGKTVPSADEDWFYFSTVERVLYGTPSVTCSKDINKFTVSPLNGNGDLDYPVGLLTSDEIMLAGGMVGEGNDFYLNTPNYAWWAGSPHDFYINYAYGFYVGRGGFGGDFVAGEYGVRPSVSLKPGFNIVDGGTGTVDNPYVVS